MTLDRPFITKTDWVYNRLRAEILDGSLKPDDRLRLTALARRFETSEMPVREALRMLQRDGLIAFESHRGATVVNLSLQRAAEIVAIRMHLEVLAVAEAVPHHTASSLSEVTGVLERMDRQAEGRQAQRFTESNRRFHTLLYQPGPNGMLIEEIQNRFISANLVRFFGKTMSLVIKHDILHRDTVLLYCFNNFI